jgi:hypothetical protein
MSVVDKKGCLRRMMVDLEDSTQHHANVHLAPHQMLLLRHRNTPSGSMLTSVGQVKVGQPQISP